MVVAGGQYEPRAVLLNADTLEWSEGPSLPYSWCCMASFQYGNTFAMVGGGISDAPTDLLFKYNPEVF